MSVFRTLLCLLLCFRFRRLSRKCKVEVGHPPPSQADKQNVAVEVDGSVKMKMNNMSRMLWEKGDEKLEVSLELLLENSPDSKRSHSRGLNV